MIPARAVRGQLADDARRRALELREPRLGQPALERRDDDQVDESERAGQHEQERQAEACADAADEALHRSRKRYPAPRTVRMYCGSAGSRSSFSRTCRTWTSIVRGSRYSAPPQT